MLKKLRAKPDHIKKVISLGVAIVVTAIIFIVWLSSFEARQNGEEAREKTLSPIAGFMEVFQGVVLDTKESMSGVPSYIENIDSQEAGTTTPTTSTSTPAFDFSGVVIIDPSVNSWQAQSESPTAITTF